MYVDDNRLPLVEAPVDSYDCIDIPGIDVGNPDIKMDSVTIYTGFIKGPLTLHRINLP